MERKTRVHAEPDKQELFITREFDLPVALLFQAHTDPALVEQWMRTKVLKLENRKQGAWQFETSDAQGAVVFRANGVFHDYIPDRRIIRTFEMENIPFAAQLEYFEFESINDTKSKLTMQIVFKSVALRDQLLQMPFAHGIHLAHNRLESIAKQL